VNTADATRVAVVGVGTGAVAATLVGDRDTSLRSIVALRPPDGSAALLHRYVVPRRLSWLGPRCEWTFEIAYGVDASDLDLGPAAGHSRVFVVRNVGAIDDTSLSEKIVDHLYKHVQNAKTASVDFD
jgi:hypothetical protein